MKQPISTPWGIADHVEPTSNPLVSFVSTPSHGGFRVDGAALNRIPMQWRQASFNQLGLRGWFEEDCDWCMVVLTFRELFDDSTIQQAAQTFKHWIARKINS